jgi:hypothetical protein
MNSITENPLPRNWAIQKYINKKDLYEKITLLIEEKVISK